VDFEFSDEQEALRASVRRLLGDRAPLTYVRDHYDGAGPGADDAWKALAALGAVGLTAPEVHGGAGRGMVDAAVVLEELGRACNPSPYASSAIGATALVVAAGRAREHAFLLPGLADGTTIGTLAVYEPARRYRVTGPATTATRDGERWRVDGTKVHVAGGATASLLLVTANVDGELGVFAIEAPSTGVAVTPTPTVDGSRKQATVELDGATAWRIGSGDATDAVRSVTERLAVAYVVDGVGAAARALELVLEYAKERVQFDKPIGSFQAVQHLCADMLRVVELGRAAAYYACWAIDDASPAEAHRAATMAQAYASDAFAQLGGSAIQVFGGIGFTWEHDIHLFYKRLLTASLALGTADEHLEELASIALATPSP
jgi:alkylation response protein AidB-like acyl-CoA dehydrogenase